MSDPLLTGLTTPLGLAVGSEGSVYVAQSFIGTLTAARPGGSPVDLVSPPADATGEPTPITGVAAFGRGTLTYLVGGEVKVLNPSGRTRTLADVSAHETTTNPDKSNTYGFIDLPAGCQVPAEIPGSTPYPGQIDSNPYAVAILDNGDRVVADAGGNSIVRVTPAGRVSTLAVLPPRPFVLTEAVAEGLGLPDCTVGRTYNFEPVPTDVETGADGMLYVSSLPGGPEDQSLGARGAVFRVNPATGASTVIATGFAGASDLAVTPNGDVYVTELFGGRLSRATPAGPVTVAEMTEPAAVEYAGGKLYVAAGVFSGPGSVVTVTP